MSPALRWLRTFLQVAVAVAAAIPVAVPLLGVDAATTAKVAGFAGAVVLVVAAIQNGLESKTGKTLGAVPSAPAAGAPPGGQGSPPGPGPLGPPPRGNEP